MRGLLLAPQLAPLLILVPLPLPRKYFHQGGPEATGIASALSMGHGCQEAQHLVSVVRTSPLMPHLRKALGVRRSKQPPSDTGSLVHRVPPAAPREDRAFAQPSAPFLMLLISVFFPICAGYSPFLSTSHFPTLPHPAFCPGVRYSWTSSLPFGFSQ